MEMRKGLFTVGIMPELPAVKLLENLQSSNRTVKIPIHAASLPLKVVSSRLINDFLKDEGMVREDFHSKQKPKHAIIFSDNGVIENIELHQIMQIIIAFDPEVSQMVFTSLCKKYCGSMKLDFPEKDDVNHITNITTCVTENLGVVGAKLESDMEFDKLFTIMKLNTAFLTANIGSNQNGCNGDLRRILTGALVQGEEAAVNEQEEAAEDADDEEAADDDEQDEDQVQIGADIEISQIFKVLILGDRGVGKSTFLGRNLNGLTVDNVPGFEGDTVTQMDFLTNLGRFRLACYEFFGEYPNEQSMIGARCAILMFDVTNRPSFLHRRRWQSLILSSHVAGIPIVLCGNKIDRINNREVSPRMVAERVRHAMRYYEMSARANYNFEMPFLYLLRRLLNDNNLDIITAPVLTPSDVHLDLQAQQMNEAEYETTLAQL